VIRQISPSFSLFPPLLDADDLPPSLTFFLFFSGLKGKNCLPSFPFRLLKRKRAPLFFFFYFFTLFFLMMVRIRISLPFLLSLFCRNHKKRPPLPPRSYPEFPKLTGQKSLESLLPPLPPPHTVWPGHLFFPPPPLLPARSSPFPRFLSVS